MSQQQQQQYQPVQSPPRRPDQITYEMRANYFKAPPETPKVRFFIFGGLLVLGIFLFQSLLWTLVFGACLIPIVMRFVRWYKETHRPTMTDQEYDNWIESNLPEIKQECLRKFRIAQESSNVDSSLKIIRGFVFRGDKDAGTYTILRSKLGKDERRRSSVSRFFMIYMAEHELCMYIRDLNILGIECIKNDSTHYYDQVSSVKMDTKGIYLGDGEDAGKLISSDYFAVTMASGEQVGVSVKSRDNSTEQTVAELRKLLGEKKYRPQRVEIIPNQAAPQYGMGDGAMPTGYGPAAYPPTPQYGGYQPQASYPPAPGYPPVGYPYPNTGPFPGGTSDPVSAPYPVGNGSPQFPTYPPPAPYPYPNTGPFPGSTSDPVSAPPPSVAPTPENADPQS